MYHQRLTGIADADPLGLSIHQNFYCHIHICVPIYVNMTITGAGFDHGDRTVLHHAADQSRTTSGNQYIHIFFHLHELCGNRPIGILNQLYRCPGHFADIQGILQYPYNCNIGMNGITAAL